LFFLSFKHPLPSCASGEWGPAKAIRHFNIHPLTHFQSIFEIHHLPIIMKFQCPKILKFHGKLNSNQYLSIHTGTSNILDKYVKYEYNEENFIITFIIQLPNEGQFGLDIYARDPDYQTERRTMSHCCKYIMNYSKISAIDNKSEQNLSPHKYINDSSSLPLPKIGGNKNLLSQLGMSPISHPDSSLTLHSINSIELQFQIRKMVDFSFDLIYHHTLSDISSQTLSINLNQRLNASDYVTIKPNGGFNVIFALNLPKQGIYTFTIYAATTNNQNNTQIGINGQTELPAVFTYLLRYV